MKFLFLSDIHGSYERAKTVLDKAATFAPDVIILLGDILYHGPRNPLPEGHDPKATVELLNSYKEKIIAVRGNCDAEVDQMVLEFPIMSDFSWLTDGTRRIFLTHGHLWNPENLPPLQHGDTFVYGHVHRPKGYTDDNGINIWNPGSCSLPKQSDRPTYATYENGVFRVFELDDTLILEHTV
ncbi:MAG: phosphodiesterase [Desulfovibrionales bacterium]|nr:phosphodiesterase [Desulfovibrionales bacterium]